MFNARAVLDGVSLSQKETLGEQICSPILSLYDNAIHPSNITSCGFDGEGTPTRNLCLIKNGVLENFIHSEATARKFGVKGISIKDLPRYYKVSKACKEKGGEAIIDQIQVNEYNRDFQNSKFMSGWTSTYGMCVSVIVFFYFIGLFTVKK